MLLTGITACSCSGTKETDDGAVRGRFVVHGAEASRVPGAEVLFVEAGVKAVSDGTGFYQARIYPGAHTLRVSCPGFRTETQTLSSTSGVTELNLILDPNPGDVEFAAPPPPLRPLADGRFAAEARVRAHDAPVSAVTLRYRSGGSGAFRSVEMTRRPDDELYQGYVPAQLSGTMVQYYLEATDEAGNAVRLPAYALAADVLEEDSRVRPQPATATERSKKKMPTSPELSCRAAGPPLRRGVAARPRGRGNAAPLPPWGGGRAAVGVCACVHVRADQEETTPPPRAVACGSPRVRDPCEGACPARPCVCGRGSTPPGAKEGSTMSTSKTPQKLGLSALATLHKPAPPAPALPAVLPDLPEAAQAEAQAPVTAGPVAGVASAEALPPAQAPAAEADGKRRYLVKVSGLHCGRSRFVEARRYLTPWRIQARQFKDAQAAQAWADTLQPEPKQQVRVVVWEDPVLEHATAEVGETLPDERWQGCPKIAAKKKAA